MTHSEVFESLDAIRDSYKEGYKQAVIEVCEWLRKTQPQETLPDTTIERLKKRIFRRLSMPTVFEQYQEFAERFADKLNSLLENDTDINVNSLDELQKKFTEYTQEEIVNEE